MLDSDRRPILKSAAEMNVTVNKHEIWTRFIRSRIDVRWCSFYNSQIDVSSLKVTLQRNKNRVLVQTDFPPSVTSLPRLAKHCVCVMILLPHWYIEHTKCEVDVFRNFTKLKRIKNKYFVLYDLNYRKLDVDLTNIADLRIARQFECGRQSESWKVAEVKRTMNIWTYQMTSQRKLI